MNNQAQVKEWFEEKVCREHGFYCTVPVCMLKQTEKAIYVMCCVGYSASGNTARRQCMWMPKSCVYDWETIPMIEDYDEAVNYFAVAC